MRLKFHYYVLCSVVFLFYFIFLYSFKMLIVNPLLLNAECKPTKFISRLIVESWVMTHGLKNYIVVLGQEENLICVTFVLFVLTWI